MPQFLDALGNEIAYVGGEDKGVQVHWLNLNGLQAHRFHPNHWQVLRTMGLVK